MVQTESMESKKRRSSAIFALLVLVALPFMQLTAFCDKVDETDAAASQPVNQDNITAQDQLIIEALRKLGPYNMAASFLGSLDRLNLKQILPESSTVLVPMDTAVLDLLLSLLKSTPSGFFPLFQYHVLTQQFSFHDLKMLPMGYRLQTLLNGFTAVITNNSPRNFTIDNVPISHPNVFLGPNIAVHGLNGVMNFSSHFGQTSTPIVPPKANKPPEAMPPSPVNHGRAPGSVGAFTPSNLSSSANSSSHTPADAPYSVPSSNIRIPSPPNAREGNATGAADSSTSSVSNSSPNSSPSVTSPATDSTDLPKFPIPATNRNGAPGLTGLGLFPHVFMMLGMAFMFICCL